MVSVYYRLTELHENGSLAVRRLLLAALRQRAVALGQTEAPETLPFMEKDVYGKPFFPEHPKLHFSISHTKGCVCCALADEPVGVDVELCCPKRYRDQVVKKFSAAEQKLWKDASEEQRQKLFFSLWVLKESFLKADGRGLRIPLHAFSVQPEGREIRKKTGGSGLEDALYGDWTVHAEVGGDADFREQLFGSGREKTYSLYLFNMKELPYQMAVCSGDRKIETTICCL